MNQQRTLDTANQDSLALTREATNATDVVQKWHDETHPDPWPWCREQPCHAVKAQAGFDDYSAVARA